MAFRATVALLLGAAAPVWAKDFVVTFPDRGANYPKGTIVLSQASVAEPLYITTNLENLEGAGLGNNWHVHAFPTMDATRGGVDGECGGAVTGGHFNPTFQDVNNPTVGQQGTYEIGDLGGKHGRLGIAATTDTRAAIPDTTASIIYSSAAGSKGSMWIVGRSIVIHKANGARWACANIGSPGIGTTVTFPASETLPSGSIELFQPSEADSTAMIVNLDGLEGNNKWHVHVYAVPTAGDCAGTAGHFDPMNANYAGTDAPPPYEYGDLSGKHGLLTATTQAFYTDSTLPLFGETSVLGRSIVIHRNDATASRWACATIPMRIMVSFPEVAGYPHGTIMLYQDSVYDDILTELSGDLTITASLMNFPTTSVEGFKWHVHSFPTDVDGGHSLGCSASVTGGHFNPTFQDVANPTPGEPSTYEIGDLSGKHGRLIPTADTGNTADPTRLVVRETYTDTTASILYNPTAGSKGSMWIVGRSIVIHNADGSRWVCANIGSPGIGTTVIFPAATGQPSGSVELFQPSLFWDTAMAVNLVGLEGGNKWHVHVYPVPGSGDCGGTGGHFDPMNANYEGTDAPPPYEYGDLSGKHGLLTATTQAFYSDATLPLSGDMSVLRRSIVIHRADGTRWACADMAPRSYKAEFNVFDGPDGYIEIFQPQPDDKTTIAVNLRGLGTGDKKWHVHELPAPINGDGTGPGCMRTEAHFNPTFGLGALEDGDLSHSLRHGPFGEDAVREFYQDPPLEDGTAAGITLHGNNSVVGRSIVIHKPNGDRWGCANIGPAGVGYTVVFPAREGEDKQYPEGTVQFFQAHEQALTTITVRLANMPAAPGGGLELRTMSVPEAQVATGSDQCGAVGEIYEGEGGGGGPKAGDLDELFGKFIGQGADFKAACRDIKAACRHMAAASLPIYSEDPDRDRDGTILGTSVVVYKEDGSPWACATVGTRTNSSLDQLEWEISQLNAHIVLLSAAWMRQAGQPLCGVATGFLTAIWTVFLMPGILQALIVGYMWTYAFGGTVGWPLGALCLWVGACTGAMVAHSLGNHLLGKLFSQEMRARTFLAKAENAMQATPLRLLILLRLFPLVPFNLFNYYVGATYRFKLWHNLVSLLFIFPGCIIWAGIGAAWNKYDLIQWGYAQPAQYLASIWTGVGVTIGLMVLLSAGSCFVLRRAVKLARQAPEGTPIAGANGEAGSDGVTIEVGDEGQKKKKRGLFGKKDKGPPPGAPPPAGPPPGLPPPSSRKSVDGAPPAPPAGELEEGWRQCEDDGDTYYYNDATGESRWEPPLKAGAGGRGSVVTVTPGGETPPVPPPQFESTVKESAVEMMAE